MRNRYNGRSVSLLFVLCLCVLPVTSSLAQGEQDTTAIKIDGTVHTPAEIVALIESSNLRYDIFPDTSLQLEPVELEVLPNSIYVDTANGSWELKEYLLSDSANKLAVAAEEAFKGEDYAKALSIYEELHRLEPSFHYALTLIGDTYFIMGERDSAIVYFKAALNRNFYDCHAHWFLADALWDAGDSIRAVEEITLAHLLNRNHQTLYETMVGYYSAVGTEWDGWGFDPVLEITQDSLDSQIIVIRVTPEWIPYSLVKALWAYEPGYAERMLQNTTSDYRRSLLEEREAVVCQLLGKKRDDLIDMLVNDNFFDTFVVYEIISRRTPTVLYYSTPEMLRTIGAYLNKYH